jgi:hypothetical protein
MEQQSDASEAKVREAYSKKLDLGRDVSDTLLNWLFEVAPAVFEHMLSGLMNTESDEGIILLKTMNDI